MDVQGALAGLKLQGKKNSLTREQAMGIYDDLKKNFSKYETVAQQKARLGAAAQLKGYQASKPSPQTKVSEPSESFNMSTSMMSTSRSVSPTGNSLAFTLVGFFVLAKITFSVLDYSGAVKVENAEASAIAARGPITAYNAPLISSERVQLLTSLDARRAELDARAKKVEDDEQAFKKQEQDFVARTQELRELTASLRQEREKGDKKKDGQLEQLANVYGAMDPVEAAKLIQQLDVTISLGLLKRMPEKRIGQILSLMQPERALTITKMLSGSN